MCGFYKFDVWYCCRLSSVFAGVVFFFKQKTAYEVRISDWSSDVCSSDLAEQAFALAGLGGPQLADGRGGGEFGQLGRLGGLVLVLAVEPALDRAAAGECEHAQQHPGRAHGPAAGPGHRMVHQSTLLWIGLHQIDASGLAGEPPTSVSLSSTRRRPGEAISSLARTSEYDLRASSRLSSAT